MARVTLIQIDMCDPIPNRFNAGQTDIVRSTQKLRLSRFIFSACTNKCKHQYDAGYQMIGLGRLFLLRCFFLSFTPLSVFMLNSISINKYMCKYMCLF